MKKKIYFLLLSIVFSTILPFITTAEASEKEFELGKNMWKETWEKLKLDSDNKEKIADCIIIGTVTEVKDTPDADFYFHQATISVERWIKGDATQKEVLVKYIFPARMTVERYMRGRNWEEHARRASKKEPQQLMKECKEKYNGIFNNFAFITPYFEFTEGERVLVYLTSLPIEIHQYYDTPCIGESKCRLFLGDFWPYDEEKFREIQECEGYYEVLMEQKFLINADNTVVGNLYGRTDMNLDELILEIKKKIKMGKSEEN